MTEAVHTATGALVDFLVDPEDMTNFEFYELTDILVCMWADSQSPLRKSFVDYIIIASINQRDFKGITRQQHLELTYLLVPKKVVRASKEALENYYNIEGLFKYI
jgi:hypothetical protein